MACFSSGPGIRWHRHCGLGAHLLAQRGGVSSDLWNFLSCNKYFQESPENPHTAHPGDFVLAWSLRWPECDEPDLLDGNARCVARVTKPLRKPIHGEGGDPDTTAVSATPNTGRSFCRHAVHGFRTFPPQLGRCVTDPFGARFATPNGGWSRSAGE